MIARRLFSQYGRRIIAANCLRPVNITPAQRTSVQYFHRSTVQLAKKKKGGKQVSKGDDDDDDEDVEIVSLPDLSKYEERMKKRTNSLEEELKKFRTGRASTDMFNDLHLEHFGRLIDAGQFTLSSPTKLVISVYDPAMVNQVANAIRDCGMNLNPDTDGNSVTVKIPKPSKETRELMIKTLQRSAEKAKQDVRHVRKDSLDALKKMKKSFSEDDIRRQTKEVDTLTDRYVEIISKALKEKEKELSS